MQERLYGSIDEATNAEIYQEHAPGIFAYLRMHLPTREDAEDLLIDVFVSALETEQFEDMSSERQKAWLRRVAQNKVADHYRRTKRRQVLSLEDVTEVVYQDEELAPEQVTLHREEHRHLQECVKHLSTLQQQVLHLRFVNGLRSAEIANIVGKREGAVRMLLSRTLNLLHSIYEKHE